MEPKDELLARIVAALDGADDVEMYGDRVSDAWGAAQWVRLTGPDGSTRYFKVAVEPYRPTN